MTPEDITVAWSAARSEYERLELERDALFDDNGEDAPVLKAGVTVADDTANSLAFIDAQYRVLETPAPTIAEAAWKFGLLFSALLGAGADPRDPGGLEWLEASGAMNDAPGASLYRDLIRLAALEARP
jgi:hypothetical protein